jgi:hypothetical protein
MKDQEKKQKKIEETNIKKPKKKRPYVRPSFKYERVFETNALSCGKVGVTQETCRNNRKAS